MQNRSVTVILNISYRLFMNATVSSSYKGKRNEAIRQLVQAVADKHSLTIADVNQEVSPGSELKIEIKNPHVPVWPMIILQSGEDLLKLQFAGADVIMSLSAGAVVDTDADAESVQKQYADSGSLKNLRHWLTAILSGSAGAYKALSGGRVSFSGLSDDLAQLDGYLRPPRQVPVEKYTIFTWAGKGYTTLVISPAWRKILHNMVLGCYDGTIAFACIGALIVTLFFSDGSINPEWEYWLWASCRILLASFGIGFAISAVRQEEPWNRCMGWCILAIAALGWVFLHPTYN